MEKDMKAKKTTVVKKKNPQDATLRNIRALKNRVKKLELLTIFILDKLDRLEPKK